MYLVFRTRVLTIMVDLIPSIKQEMNVQDSFTSRSIEYVSKNFVIRFVIDS